MDDNPAIITVAKGTAAVGAATSAQIAGGASGLADVLSNLFVLTPANIASWLAAIFVFCQLTEWWWMRFWRPLFERCGWLGPKPLKRGRKPPMDSQRMGL